MKIEGVIPKKGQSFDNLLHSLTHRADRNKCLKTAQSFHFYTNSQLLTKLSQDEWSKIHKLHWDYLMIDSSYRSETLFDIRTIAPKYLSDEIRSARYVGGNVKHQIVQLETKRRQVFVEAQPFITLFDRHPNANWYFSWGSDYWKKPVVLLRGQGFFAGELLGLLPTVPLQSEERTATSGLKQWRCFVEGDELRYHPKESENVDSE